MSEIKKTYLFRMTHIENIPHILKNGITHVESPKSNPDFIPIGDDSLIKSRNHHILSNGKKLGDYIPFYFGTRMPMLYVIQKGFNLVTSTLPEQIIYCVSSTQKVLEYKLDFVFTNGHAVDSFTSLYNSSDIENIDKLINWKDISARYWKDEDDLDLKRRKEAEFLILGDIPIDAILGYCVYNNIAKNRLVNFGVEESKVTVKPDFYF